MKKTNQTLLFEKFRILETIKQDTHRGVYIAEHIFLNKTIFLKTINKNNIADPVMLDRFKREAQILAQLDHPNIIKVWDFGTHEDYFYISFEHFENRNLREILRQGKLRDEEKKKLILQLNTGLQYAHEHQIIHRDLKPENILLDDQLNLKIADFGLATIENQVGSTDDTTIVGTPAYMSPEQIRGQELTGQSDLFSMGIIIYEIYCGENPFLGSDTGATLNNILNLDFNSFRTNTDQLPDEIREIAKKLLLKNINKRSEKIDFPGMEQLSTIINSIEPSINKKASYKQIWAYISVAAAAVFIIIALYYLVYKPNQNLMGSKDGENGTEVIITNTPDSTEVSPSKNTKENNLSVSNKPITRLATNTVEENIYSKESDIQPARNIILSAFLMIECQPWADIYVDEIKRESTPLKNPLQVSAGIHQVKLVHPEYPHYKQLIHLKPDESFQISVNLDTTIGYFTCRVHPWGEIFIDDRSIGQTPLNKPIRLEAGKHVLVVRNPGYSEFIKSFTLNKNDTISFNINLSKR